MTDRRFQSSIDDVVAQRAMPSETLSDLFAIAYLSEESCKRIADALHSLQGLIGNDAIEHAVQGGLRNNEANATDSVIRALNSIRSGSSAKVIESLVRWTDGDEERKEVFTDTVLAQLCTNLDTLLSDYPAVELMQKADGLLRDVGNELDQPVKFVCDLRPVFDRSRKNIEAFVLIANLRLIYISQDGEKHTCEIALTEDELKHLRDKAKKALKKMQVLNDVRSTLNVNSAGNGDKE